MRVTKETSSHYTVISKLSKPDDDEMDYTGHSCFRALIVMPQGRFSRSDVDATPRHWKGIRWLSRGAHSPIGLAIEDRRRYNRRAKARGWHTWAILIRSDELETFFDHSERASIEEHHRAPFDQATLTCAGHDLRNDRRVSAWLRLYVAAVDDEMPTATRLRVIDACRAALRRLEWQARHPKRKLKPWVHPSERRKRKAK